MFFKFIYKSSKTCRYENSPSKMVENNVSDWTLIAESMDDNSVYFASFLL